jgi:hypothetical protein
MLARIIRFKGLNGTTMGTVAIGAGAIDDATAWGLLAVVLASFDGNFAYALQNIGGGLAYVSVVLLIIRPLLDRFQTLLFFGKSERGSEPQDAGQISESGLVIALALMALGAWFTDLIGLRVVHLDGRELGAVKSVQNFGAGELIEVQPSSGSAYLLPFTEEIFPELDIPAGLLRAAPDEALLPEAPTRPDPARPDPTHTAPKPG